MSKNLITNSQWDGILGISDFPSNNDNPQTNISLFNCVNFCNTLSITQGYSPVYEIKANTIFWNRGKLGFRLPIIHEYIALYKKSLKEKLPIEDWLLMECVEIDCILDIRNLENFMEWICIDYIGRSLIDEKILKFDKASIVYAEYLKEDDCASICFDPLIKPSFFHRKLGFRIALDYKKKDL